MICDICYSCKRKRQDNWTDPFTGKHHFGCSGSTSICGLYEERKKC